MLVLSCTEETTEPDFILPEAIAPSLGDGSEGDPYQISSLENLYWLSQNPDAWDKYYLQTSDIDAYETREWICGGFKPIGYSFQNFTGYYDGDNHVIDGVFIERSQHDITGVFGFINDAEIRNLGITNAEVRGRDNVGGLAAINNSSTIHNCYFSGEVYGNSKIGGLVGTNEYATISNSYSIGTVYGDGEIVGGLAGYNRHYFARIINSFSKASVRGSDKVGGFVGANISTMILPASIENSYSRGEVIRISGSNGNNIGSFAGQSVNGIIKNCYVTGSVTYQNVENPTDKGFIGYISDSECKNNFFDSEASAQICGIGAEAKTTAEMQIESTFIDAGWDFDEIWTIDGVINDGYPYLLWER
jgi:hypothetical protein